MKRSDDLCLGGRLGRAADRLGQTLEPICDGPLVCDAEGERGCAERITPAARDGFCRCRLRLVSVEPLRVRLAMLADERGQAVRWMWPRS